MGVQVRGAANECEVRDDETARATYSVQYATMRRTQCTICKMPQTRGVCATTPRRTTNAWRHVQRRRTQCMPCSRSANTQHVAAPYYLSTCTIQTEPHGPARSHPLLARASKCAGSARSSSATVSYPWSSICGSSMPILGSRRSALTSSINLGISSASTRVIGPARSRALSW